MRKVTIVGLALLALASLGAGKVRSPEAGLLANQIEIEKRLLEPDLSALSRLAAKAEKTATRMERLSTELVTALDRGTEDPFELAERETDLAETEHELAGQRSDLAQLRRRVLDRRQRIHVLGQQLAKLRSEQRQASDGLSGNWDVVLFPGSQNSVFTLELDGTLVSGRYTSEGGWSGSFRGNLAGDKLRLERWDAERGFDATFYGRLSTAEKTIKGTWQANELADGRATSGTWVAHLRPDSD